MSVSDVYVLDTSAIFTFTDNEPGYDQIEKLLVGGVAGEFELVCSFVTLTEVRYIALQERGEAVSAQRSILLDTLPVRWIHSDAELCRAAAGVKAAHRLSFADAFVAATALRIGGIVVHKDPELSRLGSIISQLVLPAK